MEQQLHYLIHNIRKDHPEMGVREIYFKMKPEGIGRDAFESFCSKQGYMCQRKKNFTRTTDSRGVERFPNQMAEMQHLVDSPWLYRSNGATYFGSNSATLKDPAIYKN